jgi:hypothetical protein
VATNAASLTVTGTEVTVTSSPVSAVVGQKVILSATVQDSVKPASAIGGSVRFYDGATLLGTRTFSSGGATSLATTKLAVGSHLITAVWRATAKSAPLASPVLAVEVGQAASTVTLGVNRTKGVASTVFTFTATVKVVVPGRAKPAPGLVDFYDGTTLLGSVMLTTTASAKLLVTLPSGSHSVTAVYGGNANVQPSSPSNARTVIVT